MSVQADTIVTATAAPIASRPSAAPARDGVARERGPHAFLRLRITGILAAVLVAIGAIAGLRALMRPAPVEYLTATAARGAVTRAVSASGTVNPQLTIIVGSYVSGVLQELTCDYNTTVKKGQVCAKIDPRPYQTAVDQARAEVATARAQLAKDRAGLAYAKDTLERDRGLVHSGFVSEDQVEDAASQSAQAQAQVGLDEATVQQREAALKAAEVNLDYTDIRSPVDGTVVSRNVTIGQTVAASFQTPTLFLIATDLTRMEVDTNVSESDVGNIKPADKASFTVEAFPNHSFGGVVTQVRQAPQTVQNVVTYDIIVNTDNHELLLKPGMTATTRIVTEQRDDVLRVPDQALRFMPAGAAGGAPANPAAARVWVLRDGRPQAVAVTTGLDDDSFSEITGGELKQGDAVIVGEKRGAAGKTSSTPFRFGL